MSFQMRLKGALDAFFGGYTFMIVALVGLAVMMLGYPDVVTSYDFDTFGVDSWWFIGLGGGTCALISVSYMVRTAWHEMHPYLADYLELAQRTLRRG